MATRLALGLAMVVAAVSGLGCGGDALDLNVDLRTDLQPETDFSAISVRFGNERRSEIVRAEMIRDTAATGARIAERSNMPVGDVSVTIALLDARGVIVTQRRVVVRLQQSTSITVIITRACRGVTCPRAGDDPTATECLGGRCVAPECGAGPSAGCSVPQCTSDAVCTAPVDCSRGTCVDGTCIAQPLASRCASGERCDLARGCVSAPADAGPAPDGGTPVPRCGDGLCNGTDTCTNCSTDCGACPPMCGDGACNGTDTCVNCVGDCGTCAPSCGDGTCNGLETCSSCSTDCGSCTPRCGDGACSGTETCMACPGDCGACPIGCPDGSCNGGETCATCSADCGACPPVCGDGTCNGTESCMTCSADCGTCPAYCGDSACNGGESCSSCPGDCGACPPRCGDGTCNGTENCSSCPGDCGGYGHLGTGDNGYPCTAPAETWRCVYIARFATWGSQVCRGGVWVTFHLNPADCSGCCDSWSSSDCS